MASPTANRHSTKYVEPSLRFTQKYMVLDDSREDGKLLVSELVRAGDVLAEFPDFERFKVRGYQKMDLRAGDYTEFSVDNQTLLASTVGYPRVDRKKQKDGPTILTVSLIPLIKISFDRLTASLVTYPPIHGCRSLITENLSELLTDSGLCFGIDRKALAEVRGIVASGDVETNEVIVARGQEPGPGIDAYLDFHLEVGPIAGRLLDDGSIDFRERRIMIGVDQDQLIATKIPPVPGTPGMNVLGEEIEPKTGKDIKVKVAGDASYSRHTLEVKATRDGLLSIINNKTIKVLSRHTVHGDVDFKTGNIETKGCLIVHGSVKPGFKVFCGGDLEIGGSIMSAYITGEANIVVKGGVIGRKSIVTSEGDTDIKFIEQGRLRAGGLVVIRSQAYFSTVTSKSDIRCHPSSKIMGGSLVAGGYLSVGTIGSQRSDPSILGAGIDPDRLSLFRELQREYGRLQTKLIQWLQLHGNKRSRQLRKLENNVSETRLKLLKLNLIPGTELYSRAGRGRSRDEIDELSPLYHQGLDIDKIFIDIHGTAYQGIKIMLGNRSITLQQSVSESRFKLSPDMKEIIAEPLGG